MSYLDDDDDSPALAMCRERVASYLDGQDGTEDLRSHVQPNAPWPGADNPMLGYLIARATESGSSKKQVRTWHSGWFAVHAWFESAVETRAELIRHLGA